MSEGFSFRPAVGADLEAILLIDPTPDPSRRDVLARGIELGQCHVALVEGRIAAHGILERSFYGHGFVALLVVGEAHRRCGIGSALLGHLESVCETEKLFTSTNESNQPMRKLLEKLGWQPSGVIENLDEGDLELVFFRKSGRARTSLPESACAQSAPALLPDQPAR